MLRSASVSLAAAAAVALTVASGMAASGCASTQRIGPTTGQGQRPTSATTVLEEQLNPVATGPAPFLSVPFRRQLTDDIETSVLFCIDRSGSVVYTEIAKTSRHREFDAQVREYFARSVYTPYPAAGDSATPACTTSSVGYKAPSDETVVGGRPNHAQTTRANSYVAECYEYAVVDKMLVCSSETTRRHERIINN